MRKNYNKILTIIFILSSICASSQGIRRRSFVVQSLEGIQTKVNIEFNNIINKITISLGSSDTLTICDYMDSTQLEKKEVINKKFLFLSYKIFGGSGVELGATVCICISKGHLYNALDIISTDNEYFSKTFNKEIDEQELYDESKVYGVNFVRIEAGKKNNYRLIATQYDTVKSKHDPITNHEIFDTLRFNFDKKNKVFCNKYFLLNGNYSIVDNPNVFPFESRQKDFKKVKYPGIEEETLGTYISIDGVWYTLNNSKKGMAKEWDVCN